MEDTRSRDRSPHPELVQGHKNSAGGKLGGIAPSNLEIALLKQYPFDSAVQRMTVVAKKKGAQYYSVFIKGAPEKVASFCRSETSELCLFVCPACVNTDQTTCDIAVYCLPI